MAESKTNMADVVVVYGQHEYCVQAVVEPGEGISIDLLQCQVLSLVGILPDNQILVTSRGEIIASPHASLALPALPVSSTSERVRLFVLDATQTAENSQLVPPDWHDVCTRCTFGGFPVVQPAFRAIGANDSDALVCGACAATCGTDTQAVTPLVWQESKKLAQRFISELLVVAGEPHVPPPPGFEKIPGDLNYSASGDFVHLFVKRGGSRAVTQVRVVHKPRSEPPSYNAVSGTSVPVDCNSGSASETAVFLSYDSIPWSQPEAMATYGITDLVVITGTQTIPVGFVRIPQNLNEAAIGTRVQELYLCYKLGPLGGFACAVNHGAFGECLFQSRHHGSFSHTTSSVVASGVSPQSDAVLASLDSARQRADSAFLEQHYRAHEPTMRRRLASGMERVRTYEDPLVQAKALQRIPVEKLHERARANPSPRPSFQDELVMQLTHWFKREFFTWMNQPKCTNCGNEQTQLVRTDPPSTSDEHAGQAGRVEVYQCAQCRGFTRFPRYNDPVKLLDTRTGRCGEWANCFTLCCRAMGFEARYVLDVTDHVWTEVYSAHLKRWLHCDSCEDQLDAPLTYEVGWGKKLSYIFSFSHEQVVDSARRYTQNWGDMALRRTEVSEPWLASTIASMNQSLRQTIAPERIRILDERAIAEQLELQRGRQASAREVQGRVSGSDEWKSQRSEDGANKSDNQLVASGIGNAGTSGKDSTMTVAEITQSLVKNMLLGCDRKSECNNPLCLHKRALVSPQMTPTDRAAQALQQVAAMQSQEFSCDGLASMLCAPVGDIRDFVLSQEPLVYLPLQDSETVSSSGVVDISGHEHHAQSDAPRCKPFRISTHDGKEVKAGGLQLLPGSRLTMVSTTNPEDSTLSWLMRIDEAQLGSSTLNVVLRVRLANDHNISMVMQDGSPQQFYIQVRVGEVTATSSSCFRTGMYYHVAVVNKRSTSEIVVYANATEAVRLQRTGPATTPSDTIVFEGSLVPEAAPFTLALPVISHVALLATVETTFCEEMAQRYVCQPPLQAFDCTGPRPDKTCDLPEARLQSGYRVACVRMWGGDFFDGIQFVYEKPTGGTGSPAHVLDGPLVGNRRAIDAARSPTVQLALLPKEYITSVSGRKGAWTDCLVLETSFGRRLRCGGDGGGDFRVQLPPHSQRVQIRAVQFDVGDQLVDAVAFVADAPANNPEADESLTQLRKILENAEPTRQHAAINAATRYLENIASSPQDPKFQKIRASNKFFATSVGTLAAPSCVALMEWCGFLESKDGGETFYTFKAAGESIGDLSAAAAAMRLHYLKAFVNKR